ncbi:hypothetical protein K9B35_10240 [Sphingomonas sp. R647]|uniref:hypothetical protein n=1 Tax=Sphingomonas sp. R647 TaxID=2875233 RepID=UPI001CD5C283|nr:hypothetical protein [Sphingomonas sp. R647]MCA1198348.1 hypothetical protein [Sphingomonas sp. R647]
MTELPVDPLSKAYWQLLDERRCAILQFSKEHLAVLGELDRTDTILLKAGESGLTKHLTDAAAKWRKDDAVADKICDFQAPGWRGRAVDSLKEANDALESAVRSSAKG